MTRSQFAESIGTTVWSKTKEIYDAIDSGLNRITVRACNGAGKTNLLATLIAYELSNAEKWEGDNDPPSLAIICTGATWTQLHNSLWPEIKRAVRKAGTKCDRTAGLIKLDERRYVIGIAPGKIESGQGYHADRVIVVIDEATGMTKAMMDALTSNAAGADSLIIMTYNPLDSESAIFDIEENDNSWTTYAISAFDHPNVIFGEERIKGAVTREAVEFWLKRDTVPTVSTMPGAIHVKWNNTYWHPTPEALARVCGEWSIAAAHGFIPMTEILLCCNEKVEVRVGTIIMGLDVSARGDDRTVASVFNGNEQMFYQHIQSGEYNVIGAFVEQICIDHKVAVVCIDDTGVGNAVTVRLKQSQVIKDHNIKIIPVNFAAAPKGFERDRKPHNARAEMYMVFEGEIRRQDVKLIYKPDALKEIAAARIVPAKGTTTVRLEDKALIKRRLGRSPDFADATVLARYAQRLLALQNQPLFY